MDLLFFSPLLGDMQQFDETFPGNCTILSCEKDVSFGNGTSVPDWEMTIPILGGTIGSQVSRGC